MKNLDKISLPVDELRQLKVGLVYLFGSQIDGTSGPMSDIDIGVVFSDPKIAKGNTLDIYNKLYLIFSDLFDNERIDLVLMERASLELRSAAVRRGRVLFSESDDFRDVFEHNTIMAYVDFKPILNSFDKAIFSRIK